MFGKLAIVTIILGVAYLQDYRVLKNTGRKNERIIYLVAFAVGLGWLVLAFFNERAPSPIAWLNNINVGWMSHE